MTVMSAYQTSKLYSQHRQNYQNKYFQTKVGKELPKQFPKPPLVGKRDVSNFAPLHTAKTLEARNYLK